MLTISLTYMRHFVQCTVYTFPSIWIYRGGECQAAWFSKFSSRPCQSRRWAHNCQSLWERGGRRQESTREPVDAGCIILYGGAPQHVYTHSARQLWASWACLCLCFLLGSLSQPHSSSSNSPALIGLLPHLLSLTTSSTSSRTRYRCTWSSAALSQHTSLCIWIAYVGSWAPRATLELIPGTALSLPSYVGTYLSLYPQWCGSPVMMCSRLKWIWGYNAQGLEASWQVPLTPRWRGH